MQNLRQPLKFDKGIVRFEVAKRHERVRKQLSVVFPRV